MSNPAPAFVLKDATTGVYPYWAPALLLLGIASWGLTIGAVRLVIALF